MTLQLQYTKCHKNVPLRLIAFRYVTWWNWNLYNLACLYRGRTQNTLKVSVYKKRITFYCRFRDQIYDLKKFFTSSCSHNLESNSIIELVHCLFVSIREILYILDVAAVWSSKTDTKTNAYKNVCINEIIKLNISMLLQDFDICINLMKFYFTLYFNSLKSLNIEKYKKICMEENHQFRKRSSFKDQGKCIYWNLELWRVSLF